MADKSILYIMKWITSWHDQTRIICGVARVFIIVIMNSPIFRFIALFIFLGLLPLQILLTSASSILIVSYFPFHWQKDKDQQQIDYQRICFYSNELDFLYLDVASLWTAYCIAVVLQTTLLYFFTLLKSTTYFLYTVNCKLVGVLLYHRPLNRD